MPTPFFLLFLFLFFFVLVWLVGSFLFLAFVPFLCVFKCTGAADLVASIIRYLGGALTALLDASGSPKARRRLQGGDLGALRLDSEGIWEGRRRLSIKKYQAKLTLRVLARILAYGPSAPPLSEGAVGRVWEG